MKRVCIVGYGAIGPIHAKALEKAEQAEIYAICDIDGSRRRRCTEKYSTVEYEDFDTMLQDEDIDSVHICTPHYLHFEMVKKALETWQKASDGKATKIIIPSELQGLAGLATSFKEIIKD